MSSEQVSSLEDFLLQAERERFYGEIVFQYKRGNVVMVRKNQTIPPDTLFKNGKTEETKDERRAASAASHSDGDRG